MAGGPRTVSAASPGAVPHACAARCVMGIPVDGCLRRSSLGGGEDMDAVPAGAQPLATDALLCALALVGADERRLVEVVRLAKALPGCGFVPRSFGEWVWCFRIQVYLSACFCFWSRQSSQCPCAVCRSLGIRVMGAVGIRRRRSCGSSCADSIVDVVRSAAACKPGGYLCEW